MSDRAFDKQLLNYFHALTKPEQAGVLNYLKSLLKHRDASNTGLLKLAGSISSDDLELMKNAIEEGCGNIDPHEW